MKLGSILATGSAFVLGAVAMGFCDSLAGAEPADAKAELYRALETFGSVLEITEKNYVEPVDSTTLVRNGANAMLKTLDPHSGYVFRPPVSQSAGPTVSIQRLGDVTILRIDRLTPGSAEELDGALKQMKSTRSC